MRHSIFTLYKGANDTTGVAATTTGDKAVWAAPCKLKVRKVWALIQGSSTHQTAFVYTFYHRPTAGSTGSQASIDTLSKTASTDQQGKFLYSVPSYTTTINEGDEIACNLTTANGDSCTVWVGCECEMIPEIPANNTAMVSA